MPLSPDSAVRRGEDVPVRDEGPGAAVLPLLAAVDVLTGGHHPGVSARPRQGGGVRDPAAGVHDHDGAAFNFATYA